MSEMSMQHAALTTAIGDLRHTADQLDHGRTQLHRSFASFLGGEWTGQAAESFVGGWDDWSHGVGEVLGALRTMADLMSAHGTELLHVDGASHASVGALQTRLGPIGGAH